MPWPRRAVDTPITCGYIPLMLNRSPYASVLIPALLFAAVSVATSVSAQTAVPADAPGAAPASALIAASAADTVSAPSGSARDRERSLIEILSLYNSNIAFAMASIETLRVEQEIVEPAEDGAEKRARAVLTYRRGGEMQREELFSDVGHPVGDYRLESLVGPEILTTEYDVKVAGTESVDGVICYRLDVEATERDSRHFDGNVWVSVHDLGLVRITGEVADAPFPVQRVTLDKTFESVAGGLRLLRDHTAEVDIRFAFITRHGLAHILYTDYDVSLSTQTR